MKNIYVKMRRVFLTIIALLAAFRHTVMRRRRRRAVVNAFVLALMCTVIFGGLAYRVLSFEPKESEFSEMGEIPEETETENKTQNKEEAEVADKTETVDETETTDKTASVDETESTGKIATAKETETTDKTATVNEAESAGKTATSKETETTDKTATVKETKAGDKNIYEDEIIIKKDSDENKDFDVTAVGYEGVYDGGEHSIAVVVNDSVDGVTIEYSESEEGPFSYELPFYLDVGTYTVFYKVSADGYNTLAGSKDVVITKRPLLITPLADQKKEYGAVDVKPYPFEMEGLVPLDIIDGEIAREEGEEVGSYKFTTGTLEHEDYEFVMSEDAPTFNIVGKPIVASMITQDIAEYNYDGKEHSPVISVKDGDKEMTEGVDYSLTGDTKATDPGDYLIFVQGLGNYAGYVAMEYKIVGEKKAADEQSGGDSGVNKPEDSKTENSSSAETSKVEPPTTDTTKTIEVTEITPNNSVADISGNQGINNQNSSNASDSSHQVIVETTKGEKTVSISKTTKKSSESKSDSTVSKNSDTKALAKDNENKSDPTTVAGGSNSVKTGDNVPIGVIWYLMFNTFFVIFLLMGSADAYQDVYQEI